MSAAPIVAENSRGRITNGSAVHSRQSVRLSNEFHPSVATAHEQAFRYEITAAVTTAIQKNPMAACFRASAPTRHPTSTTTGRSMTTALRKRGQRAWQRAMRAGGPFAPGSIIGAVAAQNHRLSIQTSGGAGMHGAEAHAPCNNMHPSPSPSFHSIAAGASLATSSVCGTLETAPSEAGPDLSCVSQAASEASSYHSTYETLPPRTSGTSRSSSSSTPHLAKQSYSRLSGMDSHRSEGGGNPKPPPSPHVYMAGSSGSDRGPFSHSSHPAVEAFRAGQLGLGFSGGGFLFPWHCLDLHDLVAELLQFADDCRTNGTAGRLRFVIEHFMTKALPADAHLRCSGKTHIQLTRVFPYLKVMTISEYHSKEDLVSAIATSCHIPAYNDGSLVCRYRGGLYIDGGVLRHIPAPPKVAFSAGVSCVPLKFLDKLPGANRFSILRSLAISPDMFQDFPYEWQQLANLVLVPAADPVLLSMIEHGKRDAHTWAATCGLEAYLAGTLFVPQELGSGLQQQYSAGRNSSHNPQTEATYSNMHSSRSSTKPSSRHQHDEELRYAKINKRSSPPVGGHMNHDEESRIDDCRMTRGYGDYKHSANAAKRGSSAAGRKGQRRRKAAQEVDEVQDSPSDTEREGDEIEDQHCDVASKMGTTPKIEIMITGKAPVVQSGVWDSVAHAFRTHIVVPTGSNLGSVAAVIGSNKVEKREGLISNEEHQRKAAVPLSSGVPKDGDGDPSPPTSIKQQPSSVIRESRSVTIRIRGQGGLPDTLVTVEVPL
ncbi:hypothetical protein CEUSTIGMA_g11735.t1 [Chlamydomonas eustigma]|uniref:PNPLA domain-containing protein n=1 Tax=Chlamydomonas eustigma TaxID=1157962 RepID=A0A250XMR2_9CHLO|nr:hypothetical protein CEUSTIGMA_g11735.t1 [Chlamydomonas eustigma]|eukprot:GAX84313.1 hypothetical protein CEUSTIGMA_g11735.t1 [Chlamydomonas eustigma]